jgi:hypothetical protein
MSGLNYSVEALPPLFLPELLHYRHPQDAFFHSEFSVRFEAMKMAGADSSPQ